MAIKRPMKVHFEGPCTDCTSKTSCAPYSELHQHLFSHAKFRREPVISDIDKALDEVVKNYITSLKALKNEGKLPEHQLGNALSALVDLCITGVYTNGLVDDQARFSQRALRCGHENAVFPYTWMCPLCVAKSSPLEDCYLPGFRREKKKGSLRDYPEVNRLAKPGGRAIGDQGIQVVKALLRATLAVSGSNARLRDGGGARGEFDLTVATDKVLAFIEVKAKPLIAYPLKASLVSHQDAIAQHEWIDVPMSEVSSLALFMAATDKALPLSIPQAATVSTWPLPDIARLVSEPKTVAEIMSNWNLHADAYAVWKNEPDNLRWHRFGCGNFMATENGLRVEKRVANTKELPGLDRTDDIKKGAAQVLKYSRLKFQCQARALRAVLLGNTHALTHHDDYVSPLLHLKVIDGEGDPSRAEWIFDAMIGLTSDHFNAPDLANLFAFHRLLDDQSA